MEELKTILGGLAVLGVIIAGIGYYLRCPNCESWFSRKNNGSKITGEENKYETVTRYDIHKNSEGKEIGRTERKEQIYVKYTHLLNYHTCSKCNHDWTTTSVQRKEI